MKKMSVDTDKLVTLYAREDIVAKIQIVDELEKGYRHTPHFPYWSRVQKALEAIPEEHKEAAISVFANVVYLPDKLIDEIMLNLTHDTAEWCKSHGIRVPHDVHFFAVDHPFLVEEFYRIGDWSGRLDQIPQRFVNLVSELLQKVEDLPSSNMENKALTRGVFQKKVWVIVTDNALSGGSLKSDIEKLQKLQILLGRNSVEIVVCAQVITEQATKAIESLPRKIKNIFYGLRFDNRFRVNNDECKIFNELKTIEAVRRLCEWFGQKYFSKEKITGTAFEKTLKKHTRMGGHHNFAYGWLDGGYTIVAEKNCPSNSIPTLWYPDTTEELSFESYRPPFRRGPSRPEQKTAEDTKRLGRIEQSCQNIKSSLWG